MTEWVLATGSQSIVLAPELSVRMGLRRDTSTFTARDMTRYSYVYDTVGLWEWDIPLRYVPQSDRDILEAWFRADTQLTFAPGYTADTFKVALTGKQFPLSQVARPYDDQWHGTIRVTEVLPLCPGRCVDVGLGTQLGVGDTVAITTSGSPVSSSYTPTQQPTQWTLQHSETLVAAGAVHVAMTYQSGRFYAWTQLQWEPRRVEVSCDLGASWGVAINSQAFTSWIMEGDKITAGLLESNESGYMEWLGVGSTTQVRTYYPDATYTYDNLHRHRNGKLMAIRYGYSSNAGIYDLPNYSVIQLRDQWGWPAPTNTWLTFIGDDVIGDSDGNIYLVDGQDPTAGYTAIPAAGNPLLGVAGGITGLAVNGNVYVARRHRELYRSVDSGQTWHVVVPSADGYYQFRDIQYRAPYFVARVWQDNAGLLYSTTAESGSWTPTRPDSMGAGFEVNGADFDDTTGKLLVSAVVASGTTGVYGCWLVGSG